MKPTRIFLIPLIVLLTGCNQGADYLHVWKPVSEKAVYKRPTCFLSASPESVFVGQSVQLTIETEGVVSDTNIDGEVASKSEKSKTKIADVSGRFLVRATVNGPGGTGVCEAAYTVKEVSPTCQLKLEPDSVRLGQTVMASLATQGKVTSAKIGGKAVSFPSGQVALVASVTGTFTVTANVDGPGGAGVCQASYTVQEPPTCQLSLQPNSVLQGQTVTALLGTQGKVTSADIDGTSVSFPSGQLTWVAPVPGNYTVTATVNGPGGSGVCQAAYTVKEFPPTCQLRLEPDSVVEGQAVMAVLGTQGKVSTAKIGGQTVIFPPGKLSLVAPAPGTYTVTATVDGPGGSGTCSATYSVGPNFVPHSFKTVVKDTAQPKPIDILWIVDNSGSMGEHQQDVSDNTSTFIQEFTAYKGIDWKMGLISTDKRDPPYAGFSSAWPLNSTMPTGDAIKAFKDAVSRLGTSGSGVEQSFTPLVKQLTKYPEFLRSGATLGIIIVTDAPEQSWLTADDVLKFLLGRKATIGDIVVYGIFGPQDPDIKCPQTDDFWLYKGSEYEKFVNATHGQLFPLCKPFGKQVSEIGKLLVAHAVFTKTVVLSTPAVAASIVVRANGIVIPPGPTGYWTYDAANNAIVFHDFGFTTLEKQEIEVTYDEPKT